jgi:hypothetical protein
LDTWCILLVIYTKIILSCLCMFIFAVHSDDDTRKNRLAIFLPSSHATQFTYGSHQVSVSDNIVQFNSMMLSTSILNSKFTKRKIWLKVFYFYIFRTLEFTFTKCLKLLAKERSTKFRRTFEKRKIFIKDTGKILSPQKFVFSVICVP